MNLEFLKSINLPQRDGEGKEVHTKNKKQKITNTTRKSQADLDEVLLPQTAQEKSVLKATFETRKKKQVLFYYFKMVDQWQGKQVTHPAVLDQFWIE